MRFFSLISASVAICDSSASFDAKDIYRGLYSSSGIDLTTHEMHRHLERFSRDFQTIGNSKNLETIFRMSLPAIRSSVVDEVKRTAGVLWTASADVERWSTASLGDAARQCGSILNSPRKATMRVVTHDDLEADIPKEFDSRKDFGPECSALIGTARDQSNCGSCWSFSTTTALEDRVCLGSKGTARISLSPLDTLSCCNQEAGCFSFGCNGGDPASAWEWFVHEGVVTGADFGDESTCKPYSFPQCAHHVDVPDLAPCSGGAEFETPECVHRCTNGKYAASYAKDKHRAVDAYAVSGDEKSIKLEILKNGPVSAAFQVYEDFMAYKSGIYHHVTGAALGGHAVKLIGWGEVEGTKYWLLLNSWNPSWGEKGAFRMRMKDCGINDEITAGTVRDKQVVDDRSITIEEI